MNEKMNIFLKRGLENKYSVTERVLISDNYSYIKHNKNDTEVSIFPYLKDIGALVGMM